jgi:magnesium transporter
VESTRRTGRTVVDRITTRLGLALLRAASSRRRAAPPPAQADDPPAPTTGPGEELITHADGFVWVDLSHPTQAEIADVAATFDLPELAVEDAVQAHQRPKLEVYDSTLFVVLKPVVYVDREEVVDVTEVALFLGPRSVVTVRHGAVPVLDQVRAELAAGALPVPGPLGVLHRVADIVVDDYECALSLIDDDVDEIEVQVFADATDTSEDHSERIYKLKREIAEFRRAAGPLAAPLLRLTDGDVPGVPPAARHFFRDVHDHALRAFEMIDAHDRLLSDVLQAEFARIAARQSQIAVQQNEIAMQQNQDMRKISAWAAIGLVPTAIAGIYGMNFSHMPELRWHYGYFAILGVIAAACTGLYLAFRRNGWL